MKSGDFQAASFDVAATEFEYKSKRALMLALAVCGWRHDRRCLCSDCKRDARQERGRGGIEPSEWLAC